MCVHVCVCGGGGGGYINSSQYQVTPDQWNWMKVKVAILGSPSPISLMVSVDVKHQSALEVNSRRKVLCSTGDSNQYQYYTWLFSHMLYQLSYSCPSIQNGKKKWVCCLVAGAIHCSAGSDRRWCTWWVSTSPDGHTWHQSPDEGKYSHATCSCHLRTAHGVCAFVFWCVCVCCVLTCACCVCVCWHCRCIFDLLTMMTIFFVTVLFLFIFFSFFDDQWRSRAGILHAHNYKYFGFCMNTWDKCISVFLWIKIAHTCISFDSFFFLHFATSPSHQQTSSTMWSTSSVPTPLWHDCTMVTTMTAH